MFLISGRVWCSQVCPLIHQRRASNESSVPKPAEAILVRKLIAPDQHRAASCPAPGG
ncbi:MAG: hypothetical protein ACXWR1_18330 [Bdellovibrionota bacterium]